MLITLPYLFLGLLICPLVFSRCSKDQETKRKHDIIQKFCNLGEMRPERCKTEAGNENTMIQIPKFPKNEKSRLLVMEMSFRIVSDLLMHNARPEWNSNELQQLHELLGHQRHFYTLSLSLRQSQVARSAHAEVEDWSSFWNSLTDYLTEKSFSSCAWESARAAILRVMRSFYKSTTASPRNIRNC